MSLKLRLLLSIGVSLLLALFLGGAALTLSARAAVRDEVRAAFQGARDEVRDTLIGDVQHTVTMRQVIAAFDGQRHVRAALLNEENNVIVASKLAPVRQEAPAWFAALIAPPVLTARIAIPLQGFPCILVLTSDSANETGEVWQLARDAFIAMVLFSAITLLFVWLITGRSLRFFRTFQSGLRTIAAGDYDARLGAGGSPEFDALAGGFNHMAARLSSYRQRATRGWSSRFSPCRKKNAPKSRATCMTKSAPIFSPSRWTPMRWRNPAARKRANGPAPSATPPCTSSAMSNISCAS